MHLENDARYTLIGVFTALAAAAIFGFIYWVSVANENSKPAAYDIVFEGSVTGLGKGADVLFNGIKVGQVERLRIDPENPNQVIGRVEVADDTPVKADTKALLEFQGLTGIAFVQFSGGSADAAALTPLAGQDVARIRADKSEFQSILDGVKDTIGQASSALANLDGFLVDNERKVSNTLANVERFSGALAANSDGLQTFLASLAEAGNEIAPLAAELKLLSADLREVVAAVPPDQITKAVTDLTSFTGTIASNNSKIDQFFVDTAGVASNLRGVSEGLQSTLSVINEASAAIDPAKIETAMAGMEKFMTAIGSNADNIDLVLKNAADISEKLNVAATKIDAVIAKVDSMVSSEDSQGMFSEFSETAKSIRVLAERLDARTAELSKGLGSFTGQGLREFEALASDGQRTLRRLERVIGDLEKNPSRFIFGGENVREYRR